MSSPKQRVINLTKQSENQLCAECKARNPRWCLTNLGIFVCLDCYKYHKSIEKEKCKAKSLEDDTWTTEEATMMERVGNDKSNQYYEYFLPKSYRRPIPYNATEMTNFIKEKYVDEYWANRGKLHPNSQIRFVFEDAYFFGSLCFRLFILAITFVLLLIMLLLKWFKVSNWIIQSFSLNLIIFIECLIINLDLGELKIGFIYQIIFGILGFNYYKAFCAIASTKLILNGLMYGYTGILLIIIASILIYIGFGLENMIISIFSSITLLISAQLFLNEAKKRNIKMFWEF